MFFNIFFWNFVIGNTVPQKQLTTPQIPPRNGKPTQRIMERMLPLHKGHITPQQYDTWFRDITSVSFENNTLVLMVQSEFFVDQLEERHLDVLRAGIKKVYGPGVQLSMTIILSTTTRRQ